eukprot:10498572-Heterocapsa_arctica.AAC.1
MSASKVDADRDGSLDGQTLSKERATRLQVTSGTRELKVIDIDHQVQPEFLMEVARGPLFRDKEKTNTAHVSVTVLLPEGTAMRMPVKCFLSCTTGRRNLDHPAGRSSGGRQIQEGVPESSAWM